MQKGPEDRHFKKFRLTSSPRALGAVYDIVAPELLSVAKHLAGNDADAEDLVQRTFVTAIERAATFREDSRVLPWLLGILAFHAKNEKRRAARDTDPARLFVRLTETPEAEAEAAELDQELDGALARLPEQQQSVLKLRLRHNLSVAQIADALGRPAGTVRSQLARGMEALREVLPAGLVATTALALGLPRGLDVVRELLMAQAASVSLPKVALAKGYLTWALAPVAEVLVMKKVALAVVLVVAGVAGVKLLPETALSGAKAPLQPGSGHAELAQAPVVPAVSFPAPEDSGGQRAALRVASIPQRASAAFADSELPVGSLQVRVQDGDRSVVVGEVCRLELSRRDGSAGPDRFARTDEHGVVLFEDVLVGSVRVHALRGRDESAHVYTGSVTPVVLTLDGALDVEGRVLDVRGNPVPRAEIWLSGGWSDSEGYPMAQADGDGRFKLRAVGKKNGVFATARGFAVSHTHNPHGAAGDVARLVILLDGEGGRVNVQVVDAEGVALEGVSVQVEQENRGPFRALDSGWIASPPSARFGRSDEQGRVTIQSIPVGRAVVLARVPGFGLGRTEVEVFHDRESAARLIVLPQATLTGIVRDGRGAPLSRALVYSVAANGMASRRCTTDNEGRYLLDGLPGGEVLIRARQDQLGTREQRVALRPGAELDLDFSIQQEPRIHGQLVDEQGRGLAGYLVLAFCDEDPGALKTASGAKDGRFGMLVDADLVYRLVVRPGGRSEQFPVLTVKGVRAGAEPLLLRVPKPSDVTASLRLEVLDGSGEPYEDVVLTVWHRDSNTLLHRPGEPRTGVLLVEDLPAGAFDLELSHPDHPVRRLGTYELQQGEALDLGVQSFSPACRLSGELTGLEDEELLASIRLSVSLEGGGGSLVDRTGRHFRSRVLAPGKHQLVLRGDHVLSVFQPVELVEGEELRVDVPLVRCGLRVIEFEFPPGEEQPSWVGAQAFDAAGAVVWSSGAGRDADGRFRARVSVLPGHYRLEGNDSEGRTLRAEFDVLDLSSEAPALVLRLTDGG